MSGFAPTGVWNTKLRADTPVDANSAALVTELQRQVTQYGPWINTTKYSVPIYVTKTRTTVPVTLTTWGPDLQAAWNAVPIPDGALPAAGTDEHMAIWSDKTDEYWEFWNMRQTDGAWSARWGGYMAGMSHNPGYFTHKGQTSNWGATATGLPLLGGLITWNDWKNRKIPHALAASVVQASSAHVWPAQRSDGSSGHLIPEGTRFRIDPAVDLSPKKVVPFAYMLCKAAQDYGIIIRDQAGSVNLYCEDPKSMPDNPWPTALGQVPGGPTVYANNFLNSHFPWSSLQVVA